MIDQIQKAIKQVNESGKYRAVGMMHPNRFDILVIDEEDMNNTRQLSYDIFSTDQHEVDRVVNQLKEFM